MTTQIDQFNGTPTIVNTSCVSRALLNCYKLKGRQRALDMAVPIKGFVPGDFCKTWSDSKFCFSFMPVDTEAVHDADLPSALVLASLTRYCDDDWLMHA